MTKACVVCKKRPIQGDSTRSFHLFPKNGEQKKKWLEATGIKSVKKNTLICSDHFEPSLYQKFNGSSKSKQLLPGAVPRNIVNTKSLINTASSTELPQSTKNSEQHSDQNAASTTETLKMENNEPAIVSGEVETIIIKPDSIEFDSEEDLYWSEEDLEDSEYQKIDKNCFVTTSGEIITLNYEDIVQTPFCLENYFMDDDGFRSRTLSIPVKPQIIDRVTCYECQIVFCNEHKLLEHLMTHIDVNKMGCNICDKDLNLEEKFQLHIMSVTWQSIYYCDFCRKSCAGVVRSKSHTPPPGKTYMCHDCENQRNQVTQTLQFDKRFLESLVNGNTLQSSKFNHSSALTSCAITSNGVLLQPPLLIKSGQLSNYIQVPAVSSLATPPATLPPPPAEVLKDLKQKSMSEVKSESCENNSNLQVQDCCKPPPTKKENKNYRRPKPRVQVVSESMKHILKMSTRSRAKNKPVRNHKCSYCPVAFSENFFLNAHLREKHKFHKLKYVCNVCNKEFSEQSSYEDHVSFHQTDKNHMCFVCNLTFLSKCELEQHEKLHKKNELVSTYCDNSNNVVALDLRKKRKKLKHDK